MKKLLIFILIFCLFGCATPNLENTGSGPPSVPPPPQGTAAELTTGTETAARTWAPKTLADEYSGAVAEVVDATVGGAGDTDTTHAYSKDDIHDYVAQHDSDYDGLPDAVEAGSIAASMVAADVATQAELDAAAALKQNIILFGTGVETALGVNIGSAGAPVLFNGAGGTPSSLTLTNATGLPSILLTDNGDTDETVYLSFADGATGEQGLETDGGLTYNPLTNVLTVAGGVNTPPNSTSPQYIDLYEDTDDGNERYRIIAQAYSANYSLTLPGYNTALLASDQVDAVGDLSDATVDPIHLANSDFGLFTCSSGTCSADANSVDSDVYVDGSIDPEHLAPAGNFTSFTGNWATTGYLSGKTQAVSIGNCEGAHDGSENASTLSDSGESLTVDAYIGMTIYNITDGSSGTVTDNDGTTITATLAGGTDNDWDSADVWQVGPGPAQSGSVFYISAATTIAHPATAGYVAGYFAAAAQIVKIDPYSVSMTINFSDDGVFTDPGAGDEIDGDGTQGDFIWIHNASTTEAYSHGVNGSWADGGAS